MHAARRTIVLTLVSQLSLVFCLPAADEWPAGYVVDEESVSPDKHYGIVLPSPEEGGDDESVNYLADLQTHKLLGKIKDSDYFQHQNHRGLNVTWSDDMKFAIVVYEGRYGFDSIAVLEPHKSTFSQTDIGSYIQKAIDSAITKQSHGQTRGGYASALFRIEPGHKIRVYATALTNPKQLEDSSSNFALFQGFFDLPSKKWTASAARPLSADEDDLLDRASTSYEFENFKVSPDDFPTDQTDLEEPRYSGDNIVFRSDESEFNYLDKHLNEAYQAARLLLSPAQFTKVKTEQIAWLKKRDAASSLAEKSKLTAKRTEELQDVAW
jgi:uncharacterized protein YecT (DUF1311 family)